MSSIFGGQINPIAPTSWVDLNYNPNAPANDPTQWNSQRRYLAGLSNKLYGGAGPEVGPQGLPGYTGALSPNMQSTLLPGVYGAYSPTNPGGPGGGMLQNVAQTGTTGGTNYLAPFLQARAYSSWR